MKRDFMVERQGRWFVLYAGLLDEAHQQGLKSVRTQLIQVPSPDNGNVAICTAEVVTEKGTFTGIGDASPESVSRMMLPHLIRMAETRAKARALRDSINVGVTALEELGEDAVDPTEASQVRERHTDVSRQEIAHRDGGDQRAPHTNGYSTATAQPMTAVGVVRATQQQVKAIYAIGRSELGLQENQVDELSASRHGAPPSELSRKQASELIDSMKAMKE